MGDEKLADAKHAAKTLLELMNLAQDQVGLITFASSATLDHPLSHNASTVAQAIDAITNSDGTNITAAIIAAEEELTSSRHNGDADQVMILLSDGVFTKGGDPRMAADAAKARGIRIITIGLGKKANQDVLRAMASAPSDYYFAPSSSDLETIYRTIASTMRCR